MDQEELELLDAELEEHLLVSNNHQWEKMGQMVEAAKVILGAEKDTYYISTIAKRIPGIEMDFFTVTISNYHRTETCE